MATAKANKKGAALAIDLPECPVCMETMSKPIYQCQSGHSLCNTCTTNLRPPTCPICRQPMTQMRNWQLEDIIAKAKVPCPNTVAGCKYVMASDHVEDHLKECIFRQMDCPLNVFGKCSWTGKLFNMMDHFKDRHPLNCNVSTDAEVSLENVSVNEDDRHVYLVSQAKLLFILTVKIDTSNKMVYWAIQHIGSKKVAQQHVYEIHVTSKKDAQRKAVFMEYCFNDALKADEVFRRSKCALLPLNSLDHFVKDKKMTFRFFIKRIPPTQPKNKGDRDDDKNDNKFDNKPNKFNNNKGPGPKGPGPQGPSKVNFKPKKGNNA